VNEQSGQRVTELKIYFKKPSCKFFPECDISAEHDVDKLEQK
jgi:hypothetical protein